MIKWILRILGIRKADKAPSYLSGQESTLVAKSPPAPRTKTKKPKKKK
jgi:hypothetical protein